MLKWGSYDGRSHGTTTKNSTTTTTNCHAADSSNAIGVLPATLLAFGLPTDGIFWINYLSWPLLGFIPGIAFVIAKSWTEGKTQALIVFGTLMSFLAIFSNSMILASVYTAAHNGTYFEDLSTFFLSSIGILFILPVALFLSTLIADSNKRA